MIEIILQAERAMAVGMLDQAERLYLQAAELDPRNSIAVVGLARVAVDRGDDRAALELARRALTIDPENAAAQRLTERLEEVLRFRGEAPEAPETPELPEAPEVPGTAASPPDEEFAAPEAPEAPEVPGALATPAVEAVPAPARRSLLDRLRRRR